MTRLVGAISAGVRRKLFGRWPPSTDDQPAWTRVLNRLVLFAGVFSPMMTVPQVVKIWLDKNAAGVSLASWIAYLIAAIIWLTYGLYYRNRPLIVAYLLWLNLSLIIIVGIVVYG